MVPQSITARQLIKKRAQAISENTPPTKRVSASIRDASRRRRARVVSGVPITHMSRYAYDVKHRKARASSRPSLLFQFAPIRDVETKPAEAVSAAEQAGLSKTTVVLPRHLPRPDFREINRDTLAAIDAELADTPIEYIQDGLETLGPE